jgi:transcription-repair coupling factor (superfamily II helicase)
MFGLSDLHQMRGRVGRSNKKAFCYLLTPPTAMLSSDARKRLSTLEEFTDLGDGFKVAMRDLDIRGAGNLLGSEQSGFISDLGFEMYHKILDEAVQELKENEFKELFQKEIATKVIVPDCIIETDLQILIPDQYISNVSERLNLYSKLDNIKDKEALDRFKSGLIDRFGPLPKEVSELIETVILRWKAEEIGFEKLTLKNETLKGYFVSGENEAYFKSEKFGKILTYLQKHPKNGALKEVKNKLLVTFPHIRSIRRAIDTLEQLIA